MPKTSPPLSAVLPPLIFGTATFNSQYNPDPYALPAREIVSRALSLGVRAFDTSPYYGPSEEILGEALDADFVHANFPRSDYFLLTKVGRIAAAEFDYSPAWVRHSVERSLARLRSEYLDVVYCHDVEFVTSEEVLDAVRELRRIRDQTGTVRYVGISGYPVARLCALAELVLEETGEPLDAVMSYANYTLQNRTLASQGIARLRAAGVEVVPNASFLGMGLLRRDGPPLGGQGDWHPAPAELRGAVRAASDFLDARGERLEKVAIRSSVEDWIREGAVVGARGDPASGIMGRRESNADVGGGALGVSVMGVSSVEELDETMRVWRSILDTLEVDHVPLKKAPASQMDDRAWGMHRRNEVRQLVAEVRAVLGEWVDVSWTSPPPGFVNERHARLRAANGQEQEQPVSVSVSASVSASESEGEDSSSSSSSRRKKSPDVQLETPPSLHDDDAEDETPRELVVQAESVADKLRSTVVVVVEEQLLTPGASPPPPLPRAGSD